MRKIDIFDAVADAVSVAGVDYNYRKIRILKNA